MKFREIKNNVFYCGLNDRDRRIFDELIPLEHGTTYNSYLVKGSEKVAIIDTMYPPKAEEYLENLDENGITHVDYIIANHGEQDHSGTIPKLLEKYPEAMVVTNAICKGNIMEMLLVPEEKIMVVKNNDELSLGDKTLRFILAPGVHWPDTMFTHIVEDNLLCTCDFLGAHYTFEDIFCPDNCEVEHSAKRYYAEIMMPFRNLCKKYTKQIQEMKPDMILPSHGPIYKNPDFILNLYEDWTADEGKNLVLLPYVSMYNSTEEMIDYISQKLIEKGVKTQVFDIVTGDLGDLAMGLVDATTIVLGSSMVLAGPHPMAVNVAYLANILKPKAKFATFVGSYGWGGNLFGMLSQMLSGLKVDAIEPVLVKGKPKKEDFEKLDILIDEIYNRHKSLNLV
ncbi:TPA: FprA family A-type flavoprotein [Candidatus Scatousia excrementigallinarum]|uniref:FprA family A-type flavoprotein n=1 Tax=Candidatus Scatousia excrementigallinarum TaxID=2840935 RepID=A0A9D1EZK6_9BACT|nr:FprA family A-type flavoprotein [Candidatus Scatousia excrementigallinarum]